ncbi:MAG: LamG-like jellyroll fold domain-containing protein, partial [Planctomycetota bacterium]
MPACPDCPIWTMDAYDGNALEFDGVDDYVEIPPLNLNTNTMTISAWIKRDGIQAATYTGIVTSRDSNSIAGLSFGKGVDLDDINHELAYNWNDDPNGWDWHSGLIIPNNEWVFVALVVEPAKATLYFNDGTLFSATNPISHDIEEFDGATLIGGDMHLENRYFKGTIDDVRIYNRALSVGEIAGITGTDLTTAWNPRPIDEAKGVPKDVVLSWEPGLWAADVNGHDVYFGNDFNDVYNRDMSVYKSRQDANSYEPPGGLEFSETYYWAIDEVNDFHPGSPWLGPVWSFTIHNVYYVDANATGANDGSNWDDAFIDLQDALTTAQDSDHIWVAQGTYTPSQLTDPNDLRTATFELIEGVAIYGGFAGGETSLSQRDWEAYETILSGDLDGNDVEVLDPCALLTEPTRAENSYHVVTGNGTGARAVLDGFTITGGNATGNIPATRGGGMYCDYSSPTVTNCTFSGNSAIHGGGMFSSNSSSPTVTNCIFSGNSVVSRGGGMYNGQSSPTVTNCIFSGNSADYKGGGMCNEYSSPTVTNCIFGGNSAASKGGGMYNEYSSPTVTDCDFTGNSAFQGGGMHTDWMSPAVANCMFIGNLASDGGGMNNNVSNTSVTNCTFIGNSGINGGGMHNNNYYTPIITNCTFIGNSAKYGGGMWNNESKAIVTNCIFWNDTPDEIYNYNDTSTAIFTYSDIQGGWPGTGNI